MTPAGTAPADPLANAQVLVVEDEFLIATAVEDMLREAGVQKVISVLNFEDAQVALARDPPVDLAVFDIKLDRSQEAGLVLAEIALKRAIPFIFATGYNSDVTLPERFAGIPVVSKPYIPKDLIDTLHAVLGQNRRTPFSPV